MRKIGIEHCPARRCARPDGDGRLAYLRIVERAGPDSKNMRACFRSGEHRRPALRAELPVHLVATIGDTLIIAKLARDFDLVRGESDIDRASAGDDLLSELAPRGLGVGNRSSQ